MGWVLALTLCNASVGDDVGDGAVAEVGDCVGRAGDRVGICTEYYVGDGVDLKVGTFVGDDLGDGVGP